MPVSTDGAAFSSEAKKIIDHERIHVLQGHCKGIDEWSAGIWAKMKPDDKKSFEINYPDYKWNDSKIAGRESVAFAYEEDFGGFLKKASGQLALCKF